MNGLEGKVGVVVGGASGIGRATAIRLAGEGAMVVIGDISESGAQSVANEIREMGGVADAIGVDISQESQVEELFHFALERFGRIDLLHNVAADLAFGMSNDFDILSTPIESFDQTLAVTLRGYVISCKKAIPYMIESGGGSIVNTSSLVALQALPSGNRYSYGIAKSGLASLTQHIAVRFAMDGIRCNSVALGMVLSEGVLKNMSPERRAELPGAALGPVPGDPEAVAAAVVFLLSNESRYITGQTINVDGGASACL